MDIETKIDLILRPPSEEVITKEELKQLLETKEHPKHYIGYEISGILHFGSLIIPSLKLKDLIEAGVECNFLLADWHTWINKKLGGDMEKIKIASEYYREAFGFFTGPKLKFILGSELYHNNDEYWARLIQINKAVSLERVKRCTTIMGRTESESLDFAQLIYPSLQVNDIFEINVDIAHGGMDQRKAHILAREVAQKLKWKVPVALHNHLVGGLIKPEREGFDEDKKMDLEISAKMSKSKPWTAIFIHDSEEQIRDKLKKAWCPEKVVENNPIIDMLRHVIFRENKAFEIERSEKFGGNVVFEDYKSFEKEYIAGKIHPQDLKLSVAREINKVIKPIREHFEKPANKKLLDVFKEAEITR
jgi:tyrosyl-tRNA synthetase